MDILRLYMQYHAIIWHVYFIIVGDGFLKNHVLCLKTTDDGKRGFEASHASEECPWMVATNLVRC